MPRRSGWLKPKGIDTIRPLSVAGGLSMSSPRRLTSAILALAFGAIAVDGGAQGPAGGGVARAKTRSQRQGSLQLTLRR